MTVKNELSKIKKLQYERDFTLETAQIVSVLLGASNSVPRVAELIGADKYLEASLIVLDEVFSELVWVRVGNHGESVRLREQPEKDSDPAMFVATTDEINSAANLQPLLTVSKIQLRLNDDVVAEADNVSAAISIFEAMLEYKISQSMATPGGLPN